MSKCKSCSAEMKPMFTGDWCPNHCDLPLDKRVAAQFKDTAEKLKNVNASSNPNPARDSSASVPAAPTPPSTGQPSVGGRTNCPDCGASTVQYSFKLGGFFYCGAPGCGGKWSAYAPATTTNNSTNQKWNYPSPVTVNLGGQSIRVIPDSTIRDNHAIIYYRGNELPQYVRVEGWSL